MQATAVDRNAAADQEACPSSMIGVAADSMYEKHDTAAANPYMACVHEDQHQQRRPRCCSGNPKPKLLLALVATIIILAGAVLGMGLYFGVFRGTCSSLAEQSTPGSPDASYLSVFNPSPFFVPMVEYRPPGANAVFLDGLSPRGLPYRIYAATNATWLYAETFRTQQEAQQFCVAAGGTLAVPVTDGDMREVFLLLNNSLAPGVSRTNECGSYYYSWDTIFQIWVGLNQSRGTYSTWQIVTGDAVPSPKRWESEPPVGHKPCAVLRWKPPGTPSPLGRGIISGCTTWHGDTLAWEATYCYRSDKPLPALCKLPSASVIASRVASLPADSVITHYGVRHAPQLKEDVVEKASLHTSDSDYIFYLETDTRGATSGSSVIQLPAAGDPRPNASHMQQTVNPHGRRTVTLVLQVNKWANQLEALDACNKQGATLFIPHTLEDLWQFTHALAAARTMHKDPIYSASEMFLGEIWLGDDKKQPNMWSAPGSASSGPHGLSGMNISVFRPGTPPWAPTAAPGTAGPTGDCLQLISWSNLQYASWLQWAACKEGAAYACVKTA